MDKNVDGGRFQRLNDLCECRRLREAFVRAYERAPAMFFSNGSDCMTLPSSKEDFVWQPCDGE